jgi:hypothetical protein
VLLVHCGPEHVAEREYAVGTLLGEFLGLEHRLLPGSDGDVVIGCPAAEGQRRLIVRDALFRGSTRLLDAAALPQAPLPLLPRALISGVPVLGDLPVLYGDGGAEAISSSAAGTVVELGVDVFGGAFALLTRLEEAVLGERDDHGRFPFSASLAAREGFSDRPLVNEYAELLWWALSRLWPRLPRLRRSFRLLPTHDVDWPFLSRGRLWESLASAGLDLRVRRNRSLALGRLRSTLAVRRGGRDADPFNSFGFLMQTSEAHGVPASFYFMAAGTDARFDSGYSLDDPWIGALLRELAARGHQVGIHPSYRTYLDEGALRSEVELLRAACAAAGVQSSPLGGRQHYLRWANPTTWRIWAAAGLDYDSTLGFAERGGFRAGTCFEYAAFDLGSRQTLSLRERPLIAMETSFLSHQLLSPEAAAAGMRVLKERCRLFGGDFVFLWHNNRLGSERERRAYASIFAD